MTQSVAVFIDGDNVSPTQAADIRTHALALGDVRVMRVYGNDNALAAWSSEAGFVFVYGRSSKNSADMLLAIDAVSLSFRTPYDVALIVSSDSDFSHLAWHLRSRAIHVAGAGETKAPAAFRMACSPFRQLPVLSAHCARSATPPRSPSLDETIRDVIATHGMNGSGMKISQLGQIMSKQHAMKISSTPDKTWRGYLSKRPRLFDLDPRGTDARVRYVGTSPGPSTS